MLPNEDLERITEVLLRRGAHPTQGPAPSAAEKSAYERSVETLEANQSTTLGIVARPQNVLKQIAILQKQIDERFAAARQPQAALCYSGKKAFAQLVAPLAPKMAQTYQKSNMELVQEQHTLTTMLLGDLNASRADMRKSYDFLEQCRKEAANTLERESAHYLALEDALHQLEEDHLTVSQTSERATAQDTLYASLLLAQGTIKLERQHLVNDHEKAATLIKNSKGNLEEVATYQMVISEAEQVLGDACLSLAEVAKQQAIAQAVLCAVVEKHESMSVAYHVMDNLSTNVQLTHQTVTHALTELTRMGRDLDSRQPAVSSEGLFGYLRSSRKPNAQNTQAYVKDLFRMPEANIAAAAAAAGREGQYANASGNVSRSASVNGNGNVNGHR